MSEEKKPAAKKAVDKQPEVSDAPPAAENPKFRYEVEYGDDKGIVEARDEAEARALFNDQIGKWPRPKLVKVRLLK